MNGQTERYLRCSKQGDGRYHRLIPQQRRKEVSELIPVTLYNNDARSLVSSISNLIHDFGVGHEVISRLERRKKKYDFLMCKLARLTRGDTYTDSVKFSPHPICHNPKRRRRRRRKKAASIENKQSILSLFSPRLPGFTSQISCKDSRSRASHQVQLQDQKEKVGRGGRLYG